MTGEYRKGLASLDSDTTCIIGHTRWKTRGNEFDNLNNQPVVTANSHVTGSITTHNGTITNADALFRGYNEGIITFIVEDETVYQAAISQK